MRMNDQIKCKIVALIGGVLLMITPVFVGAQQKVSDVRVVVREAGTRQVPRISAW